MSTRTPSPLITVVIPAWDHVPYLTDSVASALEQSVPLAVLVVDNASTIPLPALASVVEVIRLQSRVTVGAARNAALRYVTTPYVLFLDADDLLVDGACERMVAPMEAHPELVATTGRLVGWRRDTGYQAPWGFPPRYAPRLAARSVLFSVWNACVNVLPTIGAALRTAAVKESGGFGDSDRGEDWVLGADLASLGAVRFVPEVTLVVHVSDTSMSSRAESLSAIRGTRKDVRDRLRNSRSLASLTRLLLPAIALPVHEATALRRALHRHAGFGELRSR